MLREILSVSLNHSPTRSWRERERFLGLKWNGFFLFLVNHFYWARKICNGIFSMRERERERTGSGRTCLSYFFQAYNCPSNLPFCSKEKSTCFLKKTNDTPIATLLAFQSSLGLSTVA